MPTFAPPSANEREGLIAYLAQQRDALRLSVYGLTDEQARLRPTVSALSLGGLLKHAALGERGWIDRVDGIESGSEEDYVAGFVMGDDETLAGVVALLDSVGARTAEMLAAVDLDRAVPVPRGSPWFPSDVDAWSVRWVAQHIIEELSRHAGHADILRESLDGATALSLMAAAEGWPETPWIKPWRPEQ